MSNDPAARAADVKIPDDDGGESARASLDDLLDDRPEGWSARLPEKLQPFYDRALAVAGVGLGLSSAAAYLGVLVPVCAVDTVFDRFRKRDRAAPVPDAAEGGKVGPHPAIPAFVRNRTAEYRLALIGTRPEERTASWWARFYLLQFACFAEYIPNAKHPVALFDALAEHFGGDYFPFGDGVGCAAHDEVVKRLADPQVLKGPESLGWEISSSQRTFSKLTTVSLSSDGPEAELVLHGRRMMQLWLANFPHDVEALHRDAAARAMLDELARWDGASKPTPERVYEAMGDAMFHLATGGRFTPSERKAYLQCVLNPAPFFPDWFNVILGGRARERQGLDGYYSMRVAIARYPESPAIRRVMEYAREAKIPETEALRLVAIVFGLAAGPAPAKLAFAVVERLYADPARYVPLFDADPARFIKEAARLDKAVPMVSVFSREEEKLPLGGPEPVTIPAGTPIHLSIVSANRDRRTFGPTADEFDPARPELGEMVSWNGREADIVSDDEARRPPRYCPGHDFSIGVIREVASRFRPKLAGKR